MGLNGKLACQQNYDTIKSVLADLFLAGYCAFGQRWVGAVLPVILDYWSCLYGGGWGGGGHRCLFIIYFSSFGAHPSPPLVGPIRVTLTGEGSFTP